MGWTDAISLSAALAGHAAAKAAKAAEARGTAAAAHAVAQRVAQVRAELARSITSDPAFSAGPGPAPDGTPLRQACQARQRTMETRIGALRAEVRAALAGASPDLARLAALDAVLERALAPRERQLLSALPGWLAQHPDRRRPPPVRDTAPAPDRSPWQAVLLAELDLRLQPVEGMVASLGHPADKPT